HFAGRPSEAAAIHREILPKCQALFSAPSPTPVKAVLNMAGVPVGDVRLPLVPLSDEEHRELMRKMQLQITRVICNCIFLINSRCSSSDKGTNGKRTSPTGTPAMFNTAFTGVGLGAENSA